jgi:hypothetical protein
MTITIAAADFACVPRVVHSYATWAEVREAGGQCLKISEQSCRVNHGSLARFPRALQYSHAP